MEKRGPYQVQRVVGGYQVVVEQHATMRAIDGKSVYKHKQSAYRRAKRLNDACKKIDEMIKKDGAIIL